MPQSAAIRQRLLAWYDAQARVLAWRVGPADRERGVKPDPYRVWLSEVMLQQTTVPHATAYFLEFVRRWPTVEALAASPEADVMGAWAGLGYYARARNLIRCARAVAEELGGAFPDTETGLLALPGVGAYTAAAVAAIAFDRASNVVDGNVERVIARLHAVEAPLPAAKAELKRLAGGYVTAQRPGDWAQALMDHGATICRPKSPLCDRCPVAEFCAALKTGAPDTFPRKSAKAERPRRQGTAYVLTCRDRVALVQRPAEGLLGGMLGLPSGPWTSAGPHPGGPADGAPTEAAWRTVGVVEHVFTHFALTLQVVRAEADSLGGDLVWTDVDQALQVLPSVFRKALEAGLGGLL